MAEAAVRLSAAAAAVAKAKRLFIFLHAPICGPPIRQLEIPGAAEGSRADKLQAGVELGAASVVPVTMRL